MAQRIAKSFALSGDKTAIPTDSTGTELSFDRGWSSAYELEVGVDPGARDIDRPQHNELWNIVTSNIKEWQEQGAPDWQSDISYPKWSITRYTDNNFYIATESGIPSGTLPTNVTYFNNFDDFFGFGTAAYIDAGTNNSEIATNETINKKEQTVSITMSNSTYTLSSSENLYGRISISGTITTTQELIIGDVEREFSVKNNTDEAITVKTSSGVGFSVPPRNGYFDLFLDADDVKLRTITLIEHNTNSQGAYWLYSDGRAKFQSAIKEISNASSITFPAPFNLVSKLGFSDFQTTPNSDGAVGSLYPSSTYVEVNRTNYATQATFRSAIYSSGDGTLGDSIVIYRGNTPNSDSHRVTIVGEGWWF